MRRASAEQAAGVLDGLRSRLAERPATPELPRYTFSCGVAQFPDDGGDPPTLLARADERLYAAKRTGRNRVLVTVPPDAVDG